MTVVLHSCVYRKPRPVAGSANGLRVPLRPADMRALNVTLHVAQSMTVGHSGIGSGTTRHSG